MTFVIEMTFIDFFDDFAESQRACNSHKTALSKMNILCIFIKDALI